MSGWIGSPFAVYPFGAGAPATLTAPPTVPDLTAAFVDPTPRDYQLTPDSETARMPSVRQQMLIALTTIKGSMSCLPDFGIELPKKVDENIDRLVKVAVIAATKHITSVGRARINNVTTTQLNTGLVQILVEYDDLVDGGNRQLTLGMGGASSSGGVIPPSSDTLTYLGDTLTDAAGDVLTL
jgi:phage baseplate assembly protein W